MTPERLAEIRARCEAASPGPWFAMFIAGAGGGGADVSANDEQGTYHVAECSRIVEADGTLPQTKANRDFVCEARRDIPDLLAEVDRLREVCGALDAWATATDYMARISVYTDNRNGELLVAAVRKARAALRGEEKR